jgi:hypothetical protein
MKWFLSHPIGAVRVKWSERPGALRPLWWTDRIRYAFYRLTGRA